MKYYLKVLSPLLILLTTSCGVANKESKDVQYETGTTSENRTHSEEDTIKDIPPSKLIDLKNKGIGPVTNIMIPDEIDQDLAAKGENLHNQKCSACHHLYKKMIGPAPVNILERRTPEWIMNIIINPDEMLQKDSLAIALREEFNGIIMTSQNITKEQARAILEFYRTL